MLVVIGSPTARFAADGEVVAAGLGADIARAAASADAAVQIVGRVGDDGTGEAVLLDLAAAGVGHVAVLRTPGEATSLAAPRPDPAEDDDSAPAAALAEDEFSVGPGSSGLPLDPADIELALRYLPDYRVLVVVPGLDAAALATVVAAAGWSGAQLVVLDDGAGGLDALPPDATVLARPADADVAFAAVVARYAVELDRGSDPATAFAAASDAVGWRPVEA